ncbi:zinc finger CCCH domain-containing protein 19-like isoform X2 [Papaver somniferum]|uniref:zinc finger CCCH domain-containing protein 19-like isoform X2 n=1 Tax=Papaver somniferum TaxID=3469 RepID=UPI000E6FF568|nr:zinc finger CCCH domain-containing protein 19-like isoform X2 [Papaver somniferum]
MDEEEESPGVSRVDGEQQSNNKVVVEEEEKEEMKLREEEIVVELPENPPQQFELLPQVNDTEMVVEKEEEEDSMVVVSEMVDELVGENPPTLLLDKINNDNMNDDDSKVVEFSSSQVDEITPPPPQVDEITPPPPQVDDSEVVEKLTLPGVQASVDSEIVETPPSEAVVQHLVDSEIVDKPPSEVIVQQLVDSEKVENHQPEVVQELVDSEVVGSPSSKIIKSSSHAVEEMVDSDIVENPTLCVEDMTEDPKLSENPSRPLVVEDMIEVSDVVGNSSDAALNLTLVVKHMNDESQLIGNSEVVAAEMGDSQILESQVVEETGDTQILGNPPVVAEEIEVSKIAEDAVEINDMELVGGAGNVGEVDASSIKPNSVIKVGAPVDTDMDTKLVGGSPVTVDIEDAKLVGGSPVILNMDDSELAGGSPVVEESVAEEATPLDEMDLEEMDIAEESGKGTPKRKRGRAAKASAKPATRKKIEEDVCFICFDGGNLVLCDRRGCPKAYHPACVNRDEAFFRTKGRWNCGWHICSNCEKAAQYMCFTCTYSLCKTCIKETDFSFVRGNKGFCQACVKTIMLVEKNEQGDYDDKNSWEFLFKDYWLDLKRNLSLTLEELTQARNSSKGCGVSARKEEFSDEIPNVNIDQRSNSDSGSECPKVAATLKKRKSKRKSKLSTKEDVSGSDGHSMVGDNEWASNELLEFVAHMKNGNTSILSQFDVQALLLDYIKKNDLRDPRRKGQIVCDTRLKNLFGKERVGHFEMLKLLESHFLLNEDAQADDQEGNVDTEASQLDAEGNSEASTKAGTDKRRKRSKKSEKGPQSNVDDYAAIDVHNINLVYLKRNLMEDLLKDMDSFEDKVVGSFVRIRITGAGQKQDMYRLVQVVGIGKGKPYEIGKQKTDVMLEILNLNKTEEESIDRISSQDFSEDECKRLRQSIKCGLIGRLTVGDIQEKAIALQAARVNDWLEAEKLRLNHLRDRASDLGKRKELRECVEKLQLLNKPEERFRRLQEVPEVHADPNMDPSHESEEEEEPEADDRTRDNYLRSRDAGYSRKGREPISPGKAGSKLNDAWSGSRKGSSTTWEPSRKTSTRGSWDRRGGVDGTNETSPIRGRDAQISRNQAPTPAFDSDTWSGQAVVRSESSQTTPTSLSTGAATSSSALEAEKIWHYKDPSGKKQGPFSMVQLRKWSTTGYFPAGLKVWRDGEEPEDSISLTDALNGKFESDLPQWDNKFSTPQTAGSGSGSDIARMNNVGSAWNGNSSLHIVKPAEVSNHGERMDYQNPPTPTPTLSTSVGSWSNVGWSGQTRTQVVNGVQQPGRSVKTSVEWGGHSPTPVVGEGSSGLVSVSISPSDSAKSTEGGENPLTIRSNSVEMQGVVMSAANPSITTWNASGHSYNNKAPEENQVWRSADSAHKIPNIMMNSRHGGLQCQGWVAPAQLQVQDLPTPTPTTTATQVVSYSNPGFTVSNSVQQQQQFTSWSPTPNTQSGNPWATAPNMQQQLSPVPPNPNLQQLACIPHTQLPPPPPVHMQQSPLVTSNPGWCPPPANANMGWGGSVQGNVNMGSWVAPQIQPQGANNGGMQQWGGNTNNSSWGPSPAANNMSESRQKHDGRYSGHRDRGGYHGGRGDSNQSSSDGRQPWNRQPSFRGNGGSSGQKGPRMCKYYESGDCRRGADCEYRHH